MSLRKVSCVRLSPWLPALMLFICSGFAASQDIAFQVDPQHSSVNFTLTDVLHNVRGSFQLKQGELQLDSASRRLSGELIVDAKSGQSGNGMRDRKMQREVLESERYPEIVFRPDRIDGSLAPHGKSSVRVHGVFSIHGADHEMSVPADVDLEPDYWNATLHFSVPYASWGMKNPSTLFLRVSGTVDIDVMAQGRIVRQ